MNQTSDNQKKQSALREIVTLMESHDISLDDIGASVVKRSVKDKSGKWLTTLLGYLGGAFIIAGLGLLTSMIWDDLGSAARVIISYGPGLIAFLMGVMSIKDKKFEKASTPLFLKSAIFLPAGMFVFLGEYAKGDDFQLAAMIVFGILAIQFLVTFFAIKRTSLLFMGLLFYLTSLGILMERAGVPADPFGIALGLCILSVAYTIDKTPHRAISGFYYFLGGLGFLWSMFALVEDTIGLDILYLPIAILMMLVSVRIQSRSLLTVSTFSLLGYLGYFTEAYFADITGWPIALIILGFIMIGISAKAVQLGQKIPKKSG